LLDRLKESYLPFFTCHEPTPSSIEMDSSSDNPIATSSSTRIPVVNVDDAPTTTFATEATSSTPGPSIRVPGSGLISEPKQLGSASGQGLKTPPTYMSDSRSPLSPSSPDFVKQGVTELERNPFAQDSSSGLFAKAQNVHISGGTFINAHTVNYLSQNRLRAEREGTRWEDWRTEILAYTRFDWRLDPTWCFFFFSFLK